MWPLKKGIFQMLFLIVLKQSSALKYQFVIQDEEIFSDCPNQPSNVLNVNGLFDISDMSFNMDSGVLYLMGNATLNWNINQTDRVQALLEVFKFDRGSWMATVININLPDSCKIMYDKNQYWYKYWTQYIINADDIKSKCINVPGTTFVHAPYKMDMIYDFVGTPLSGKHKIVITLKAFGKRNVLRETSICIEIIGELIRLN